MNTGCHRHGSSLGGYAKQISAGLDAAGNPEVFAIGSDNALYVNHANGAGWASLGGYVKEISATTHNTVFAIGSNDSVYVNSGAGNVALGGYAKQISAGLDAAGNPEVFAIGSDDALYVNHANGAGWASLGGYVKEISATTHNTVFAIGSNDSVYVNSGAGNVALGAMPSRSAPGWTPPAIQRSSPSGPTMPCTSTTPTGRLGLAGRLRAGDQRPAFNIGLSGDVAYVIGRITRAIFTGPASFPWVGISRDEDVKSRPVRL